MVLALISACLSTLITSTAEAAGEPRASADNITAEEPLEGEVGNLPFTVTLEFPAVTELTIPWRLHRGVPWAKQGLERSGQLVIAPGETTVALVIPFFQDYYDSQNAYHYTLELRPGWQRPTYGMATVHDNTRNGELTCSPTAYSTPAPVPGTPAIYKKDCAAGHHEQSLSADGGHLRAADITLDVVQYADNRVGTAPAVGDGGEVHVQMHGVIWRVAPGIVLRAATVTSDARVLCTAVGEQPLMESESSVTGLSINGAPPLGTITDEYVVNLGAAGRIVLNERRDQGVLLQGGGNTGELHRTLTQSAIVAYPPLAYSYVAQATVGQLGGNPCDS